MSSLAIIGLFGKNQLDPKVHFIHVPLFLTNLGSFHIPDPSKLVTTAQKVVFHLNKVVFSMSLNPSLGSYPFSTK